MFYPGFGFVILLLGLHVSTAEPLQPPLSVNQAAQGVLLVADRSMPDPRFQETVILILEHEDKRGTLGLVLNRPTDITLTDALPESPYQSTPLALGWGGPVGQENLFMLLRTDRPPEESERVFADIVWSASAKVLANSLDGSVDDTKLRVFLGLSSWAPGQLEKELNHGGWQLFQAQVGAIFSDLDPVDLWRHFIEAPTRLLAQTSSGANRANPPIPVTDEPGSDSISVLAVARQRQYLPGSASADRPFSKSAIRYQE